MAEASLGEDLMGGWAHVVVTTTFANDSVKLYVNG
jgi:hypothetical protein